MDKSQPFPRHCVRYKREHCKSETSIYGSIDENIGKRWITGLKLGGGCGYILDSVVGTQKCPRFRQVCLVKFTESR